MRVQAFSLLFSALAVSLAGCAAEDGDEAIGQRIGSQETGAQAPSDSFEIDSGGLHSTLLSPQLRPSLIALGTGSHSLVLDSGTRVSNGFVLANGDVQLGSVARLKGSLQAIGDVSLGAIARIGNDVTANGSVSFGPLASVGGTVVEGASLPAVSRPSSEKFAASFKIPYPASSGNFLVSPKATETFTDGAHVYDDFELRPKARVLIKGDVQIRVEGSFKLNSGAKIRIQDGGSLVLELRGEARLKPRAQIVQHNQADVGALTVIVDEGVQFTAGPRAELGPGLLYASGVVLGPRSDFEGTLVGQDVRLSKRGDIVLDSRYACGAGVTAGLGRLQVNTSPALRCAVVEAALQMVDASVTQLTHEGMAALGGQTLANNALEATDLVIAEVMQVEDVEGQDGLGNPRIQTNVTLSVDQTLLGNAAGQLVVSMAGPSTGLGAALGPFVSPGSDVLAALYDDGGNYSPIGPGALRTLTGNNISIGGGAEVTVATVDSVLGQF